MLDAPEHVTDVMVSPPEVKYSMTATNPRPAVVLASVTALLAPAPWGCVEGPTPLAIAIRRRLSRGPARPRRRGPAGSRRSADWWAHSAASAGAARCPQTRPDRPERPSPCPGGRHAPRTRDWPTSPARPSQ